MHSRRLLFVVCIFLSFDSTLDAAVIRVAKDGSGDVTSIQAAVDKASPGDEIVITDTAVYEEQVTIDSTKDGLYLHSSNLLALKKPTIRYLDSINVNPKDSAEAASAETINFDRNGALQVLGAHRIRIEGIAVDGVEPTVFGYPEVWDDGYQLRPLQFGNGAITLWMAGEVIIRYCDIYNAFYGCNVKDRNIGGLFAFPNRVDFDPQTFYPFGGAGKTGNHLVECNRIHGNSFGLYFESSWDIGSTVRFNLLYENHHPTDSFAVKVRRLTEEGNNMPGGAIMTKDDVLSPLAIYNNTFYSNLFLIAGIWMAGGQHLIFNNIYSSPYVYYSKVETFGGMGHLDMMKTLSNRMHNCVIAAQQQKPASNYIAITNDFSQPKAEGDITTKPFPASAEVRYLETSSRFLSTDPQSPVFLVPNPSDTGVANYIIDQGWDASGVKDPDGSRADLGAELLSGKRNRSAAFIRPVGSAEISGGTATLRFVIAPRVGSFESPTVKYLGMVRDLSNKDVFGSAYKPIVAENCIVLPTAGLSVAVGANRLQVSVSGEPGNYAFFEMVVEGKDADGSRYTASTGFLPYRKTDCSFSVSIRDSETDSILSEVDAGSTVKLHIEALDTAGERVSGVIPVAVLRLSSGALLHTDEGATLDTLRNAITDGTADIPVVFGKDVVVGDREMISIAALQGELTFLGVSDPVKVNSDISKMHRPVSSGNIRSGAECRYEVIDLRGRVVRKNISAAEAQLSTGTLSLGRGVYFVRKIDAGSNGPLLKKRVLFRNCR